jgi:DNA-binding CsgD family transcriptional regulator/tetratricopeptide (TPR) repeat protein
VRAFCDARERSVRVVWGGCEPLRTPRPLGPILDVGEAVGGPLSELLEGPARPSDVAAALLEELRRRNPTVLVLEDVHWADEATLDVLTVVAARVVSVPALVVVTYRDDALPRSRQLQFILGELVGRRGRLRIEPLSRSAVAALCRPVGLDGGELHRQTGGNPFFVSEVLAAGGAGIPETVRDAVLSRAMFLSNDARRLLDALSVIPGEVDMPLAEVLGGELVDHFDECLHCGMLLSHELSVSFRHELARLAIEEAMSPQRRLALHRRALVALSDPSRHVHDFARLTYHAEAAGDVEGVLRWAPHAAERAGSSGAHREAASHYATAVRVGEGLPIERRAELLERCAQENVLSARSEDAIDAFERALRCRRHLGDPFAEARILCQMALPLFMSHRADEARRNALESVALFESLAAERDLPAACARVAQLCLISGDQAGTLTWGNRALELVAHVDDTPTLVHALTTVGSAEYQAGEEQGLDKLERSLELARRVGLDEDVGRALNNIAKSALRLRRYEVADRRLAEGLEHALEHGDELTVQTLRANRADLDLEQGRFVAAADTAVRLVHDPRPTFARLCALTTLGLVRARRGDPDHRGPLEEAAMVADRTGDIDIAARVAVAAAEIAWLDDRTDRIAALTQRPLALAVEHGVTWEVGPLAYWRRAGIKEPTPLAVAEPYASSIAGEWRDAVRLWHQIGCPYEAALALTEGDDPDAMRQAIDELRQLEAHATAERVARQLRKHGERVPRGPRPRTRQNPAGLTARELDVLPLIAAGLRNAEIADRLVLSPKTVDHHMSAILGKLNAHTRTEAVSNATRLGILPVTRDPIR